MAGTDILREFLVRLGFQIDDASWRKFQEGVDKTSKQVQQLGTAAATVASEIAVMVERTGRAFESLYFFARRAGTTVEGLKELQYAAQQAGMGVNDLTQMAKGLFDTLAETNFGKIIILQRLGVQTTELKDGVVKLRDTKAILLDTAEAFHRLIEAGRLFEAIKLGEQLGFTADQVVALGAAAPKMRQAAEEMKAMYAEAGISADKMNELGGSWTDSMSKLNRLMERLVVFRDLLGIGLKPAFDIAVMSMSVLMKWLDDLDQETNHLSTIMAAIAGSALLTGGAMTILGKIIGSVGIIAGGGALVSLGLWAIALGAIGGAAAYAIIHHKELGETLRNLWGIIRDGTKLLIIYFEQWAKETGRKWVDFGASLVDGMREGIRQKWDDFKKWLSEKFTELTMPDWLKWIINPAAAGAGVGAGVGAPSSPTLPEKKSGGWLDWLFPPAGAATMSGSGGPMRPAGIPPGRQATRGMADQAMKFFMGAGWTANQAAGIVANLLDESALNPNAVNPTSGAYGIAQWLGSRYNDLLAFARANNLDPSKFETQLAFIQWELTHSESAAGNRLRRATSAMESADVFGVGYERYGYVPGRLQSSEMGAMGLLNRMGDASLTGPATQNVTLNAKTDINVNGVSDPQATGQAVASHQKRTMNDAVRNLQSAVDTHRPTTGVGVLKLRGAR